MMAEQGGPTRESTPPLDFLRQALDEPFRPGELRRITIPAPAAAAESLLRGGAEPAVYWAGEAAGIAIAGLGAAHVIAASGTGRFDEVRRAADSLWPRLNAVTHPDVPTPPARLFGGLAFQPGRAAHPWQAFGDARFHLPRLLYTADPAAPTLCVTVAAAGSGIVAEVERTLDLLAEAERPTATGPGQAHGGGARLEELGGAVRARLAGTVDEAAWADAIASIDARIREGRAEKVVAARRTVLRLERPADIPAVLRRLGQENAAEARFALRHGSATMLGATPERLITRRGHTVRTEALAGSIGAGEADGDRAAQGERLLASAKDAEEHAFVVDAVARALAPLCERLEYPADPGIKRLRHVLHLRTPFHGRLAEPVHVLDLVERLHPTPAVGGTPTAEALEWIAAHEPADRGWYAAPVGWFDARGDGDFVVALRSGLLDGDRAYLYAGAGIVRDSDAAAEFAETETKLRTMMDALGIVT